MKIMLENHGESVLLDYPEYGGVTDGSRENLQDFIYMFIKAIKALDYGDKAIKHAINEIVEELDG